MEVKEQKFYAGDKEKVLFVGSLKISIDYDDVDRYRVDKDISKLIDILNNHFIA